MNTETCLKYLQYLASEADRYARNELLSDEDMNQLNAEIVKFQAESRQSELPDSVQSAIQNITFHYTPKETGKTTWLIFASILTFGIWGYVLLRAAKRYRVGELGKLQDAVNEVLLQLISEPVNS